MSGALADAAGLLDRAACWQWLRDRMHPTSPECPRCHAGLSARQRAAWERGGRVHCKPCGRWYSARTATPLGNSPVDLRRVVLCVILSEAGVSLRAAAQVAQLTPGTARKWLGVVAAL